MKAKATEEGVRRELDKAMGVMMETMMMGG